MTKNEAYEKANRIVKKGNPAAAVVYKKKDGTYNAADIYSWDELFGLNPNNTEIETLHRKAPREVLPGRRI